MMLKNAIARLVASLLVTVLAVGEAGADSIRSSVSVNPEYLKWKKRSMVRRAPPVKMLPQKKLLKTSSLLTATPLQDDPQLFALPSGDLPSIYDYRYLNLQDQRDRGVGDEPPKIFDPRKEYELTPVRHQDPNNQGIGTCWAQASIGSIEMWLATKKNSLEQLSVRNLVNLNLRDSVDEWLYDNAWEETGWSGGSYDKSSAYFLRWGGPVLESDDPYVDLNGNVRLAPSSPTLSPRYHLQQTRWVPAKESDLDNEGIKRAILKFGGLYVSMTLYGYKTYIEELGVWAYCNYWSSSGAYCYKGSKRGGHAVTIVGWDDTYKKENFNEKNRPSKDGAFIVRDSYGDEDPRDDGYFYVSYCDESFARSKPLCAFPLIESVDNYNSVYQYDPMGMVDSVGYGKECAYGANMYVARGDEDISAVGFYAISQSTRYTIDVYVNCDKGDPVSGEKYSQSGTTDQYAGYYTIPLDEPVHVEKGKIFSIVLKLTTPNNGYPLAFEAVGKKRTMVSGQQIYEVVAPQASANKGESFYSGDGKTWYDFTEYDTTANFCCKAYTKSSTAPKKVLAGLEISPFSSMKVGDKKVLSCKATYSDGSKSSGNVKPEKWWIAEGSAYASIGASSGEVVANAASGTKLVKVGAKYTEEGVAVECVADWGFYVTAVAPKAPSDLNVTQGDDASCVRLTWTAPEGATEFKVYRGATADSKNAKFIDTVTLGSKNMKYSDTSDVLVAGVEYYYFVKAKNDSGTSDFSNGASGYKKLAPPEVRASDGTKLDGVELQWSEVAGAAYYRVYRADDPEEGAEKKAISGWIPQTEYLDDAAEAGVTYYYYVVAAVDGRGNRPSDYSIIEDGYRGVPVVPQSLEISGESSIPSGGDAAYSCTLIYSDETREENVGASWSLASTTAAQLSRNRLCASKVAANTKVRLTATYKGLEQSKEVMIMAVKPHAPISAPLVSVEENGIRVNWDAVADATSYSVFRKSGSVEVFIGNAIGKTNYLDDKAQPGVTYTYRISAGNSAGNGDDYSPYSDPVSLSLAAPGGVTATADDPDKVTVAWKAVTGAKSYRVYRAESESGSKTALGSGWQSGRFYEDTTGTAGKTYYYFVQAAVSTTGGGAGAYSAGAVGKRPQPVTLQSIEICDGATRVASGGRTVFTCKAHYSDGKGASVVPEWSVSPSGYATIDANGQLVASKVASDQTVEVVASYGGKTASPVSVRIVASVVATAKIVNVRTSTRWPFSGLMDIDYELQTTPSGTKAFVSVSGFDNDRQMAMAARTLSGDGATGTAIEAGAHRLSWDVAADYPKFRSSSLGVDLTAVPVNIFPPSEVSATPDSLAGTIMLTWSSAEDATGYEVWRGTSASIANAEKIGTVSTASFTDNSAVAGTTCYYWVRSVGEGGSASEFGTPVTAKVNPITYTIYFNANGGSGTMSSLPMVCGTAKNLPAVAFVPPHKVRTFDGWALSPTGPVVYHDQESVNNLTTVDCGSVILYAVWKRGSVNLMPLKSVLAVLKMGSVGGKLTTDTVAAALNKPTLADMDGDTSRVSDQEREVLLEIRAIIERDGVFECIAKGDYNSDLITDDDLLRWNEMSRMIENMKKN